MPRPKIAKKKDPFADLDNEFKDAISAANVDVIRQRVSEVALSEDENQRLRKEDQDLAEKKEQAKMAGETYKEATKQNRLRIQFCRRVLEDRGAM